jgi:chromosomal replication initiator protein
MRAASDPSGRASGQWLEAAVSGQFELGDEDHSAALRKAWDLCLNLLAAKVSKVTLDSYIRSAQPVSYVGSVVTLAVVSSFAREWLEKKYANQIRSALEFHLDASNLQVAFIIQPRGSGGGLKSPPSRSGSKDSALQTALPLDSDPGCTEDVAHPPAGKPAAPVAQSKSETRGKKRDPAAPCLPLNDQYTFENYLEGQSNRLAKVSAMAVAAKPGESYNPLFIYGSPGLGKSHLLQAIAQVIKRTRSTLSVGYISGEYFTQQYYAAIKDHATETFRRQYRGVDVWLVDDVQFIAGKDHTKEEFFHTFSALYQSGKQIVIASDRSPRELHALDERLRSRFQSGLIADVTAPDMATRVAYLHRLRESNGAAIPDDVIDYIADAIQSNMRTLEGAITRLVAYSSIMNMPVSAELAQDVLGEYFIAKPIPVRKLTIDEIIAAVCARFEITCSAIKGPARHKDIALARHVAMYVCRELLPEINTVHLGTAFGGRDHTTILHGCQRVRAILNVDPELKALVGAICSELTQQAARPSVIHRTV